MSQLYSRPEIYDIAFDRDLSPEIEFFRCCFLRHGSVPVAHILEPACGSGMFLAALPRYGYRVTGYDLNPASIEYARRRIGPGAGAIVGDMRTLTLDPPLDAAINTNNTISYCLADDEIRAHLRAMSASLREGAVYIVEISCAHQTPESENLAGDTWTMERDGVRVTGTWRVEAYDRERRIRHIHCRMEVDGDGFEEKHRLRLWYPGDLPRFAAESGFDLAAIYDSDYRLIPPGAGIRGEMGNFYFVLVNRARS